MKSEKNNSFKNFAEKQALKYSILPIFTIILVASSIGILLLKIFEKQNLNHSHQNILSSIEKNLHELEKKILRFELDPNFIGLIEGKPSVENLFYDYYNLKSELDFDFDIMIKEDENILFSTRKQDSNPYSIEYIDKWQYKDINAQTNFGIFLERDNFIIFSKFTRNLKINDKNITIYFEITPWSFKNILDKNYQSINFISGKFDQIISSNAESIKSVANKFNFRFTTDNKINFENEEYIFKKSEINNLEIYLFTLFKTTPNYKIGIILFMLLIISLFITWLAIKISWTTINKKNSEALKNMIKVIRDTRKGKFDNKQDDKVFDEFVPLYEEYNAMIFSIKDLFKENEEILILNQVDHLNLLNSQFDPHFLFNSLETLRYLTLFDIKSADKFILQLSKMLRYTLDNRGFYSNLKQEIGYLEAYLVLQKFRYNERLNFKINYDKNLDNIKLPKLIIQPIVENSIKYGLKSHEILNILVNIKDNNDSINIYIKDDGPGISKSELQKIKDNFKNYASNRGIGLFNVNKKLEYLYDDYKFEINNLEKGLLIEIAINKENYV